jgi:hypothetical protein
MKLLLLLIVVILLFVLYIIPKTEHFVYDGIKPRLHAKLNELDEVIYYSWQSPRANGDTGCALIQCPPKIDDNITCWSCDNYY